jgi:hypothetical protein
LGKDFVAGIFRFLTLQQRLLLCDWSGIQWRNAADAIASRFRRTKFASTGMPKIGSVVRLPELLNGKNAYAF